VNCLGNDPTAESCVGMAGAMSTTAYPIDLPDWTQYGLCHAGNAACNNKVSVYAAGGGSQASDGTDIGANVAAINLAQSRIQYVCTTGCGSSGPYPDSPKP